MAGEAFLRAVTEHSDPATEYVAGYTGKQESIELFREMVGEMRPGLETRWIQSGRVDLLKEAGTFYLPDPNLRTAAYLRLRAGINAYSLCGVTHTTATHGAMDLIRELATAPVMPWDALICTSPAVRATVKNILEAEGDYIAWRFGTTVQTATCQLPVIPLGIHTEDFSPSVEKRAKGREFHGITDDEIVFLYVGRLSPWVKSHPFPMYQGLAEVARRSDKKVTLIECGWYTNDSFQKMADDTRKEICPDLNYRFVDGRDFIARDHCWAGADIFVSLSDNLQETFGITPIEAQAAGLPVLISDWDGYKSLMEDGEQGFRIRSAMASNTSALAKNYESSLVYGRYCAETSLLTSIDIGQFIDRALQLVNNSDLRKTMGKKGLERAHTFYDWRVVYQQYEELWQDLSARRHSALHNPNLKALIEKAPKCSPARLPPSIAFEGYPTQFVTSETRVQIAVKQPLSHYKKLKTLDIFQMSVSALPQEDEIQLILDTTAAIGPASVKRIAITLRQGEAKAQRAIAILLKMGIVEIALKD